MVRWALRTLSLVIDDSLFLFKAGKKLVNFFFFLGKVEEDLCVTWAEEGFGRGRPGKGE